MRISDWSSDVCSSDLHRPAIDIALDMAATQPPDQRQVVVRLDPLGGRLHAERGREADDRRDDRRVHAVRVGGAEHEALVDLDLVERRLLQIRSEEHTSELQSLMRISYAVFCLKKKK